MFTPSVFTKEDRETFEKVQAIMAKVEAVTPVSFGPVSTDVNRDPSGVRQQGARQ